MTDEARASLERALPAYEIADRLGEGAFGVVYEGRHTQLGRSVAIKQLPRHFAEDEGVRERFVAEAQMVASLDHPHVVPVYDFVESEGSRYLIMERCEGSISDKFREEGVVTDEACAAVLACLAGLDVAHARGLLHRDVKPENLMYDTKGVVKLADFGIARDTGADTRRTATGMIVGTPAYMSPEQCRGDNLTAASDVYSVGMMAYELLTGGLPFPESDSVNGLLAHHLVTEPLPLLAARPELPGTIGEVIDRSLSKDLGVRYSTAEEMARELARACVQAFGSGWLRRRRFVLHWPEIIAETERPADNSPRTGTIMVKAGDLTHDFEAPATPAAAAPRPVAEVAPQPVASAPAATSVETPASPAAPAPAAAPPATPAAAAVAVGDGDDGSKPPWALIGIVGAALVALIVGIIALTGGGDGDGEIAVAIPTPTPVTAAGTQTDDDATDADTADADADGDAVETPTEVPEPTPDAEDAAGDATAATGDGDDGGDDTADAQATAGDAAPTVPPGPTPPEVNYDSSGNIRFEPTEQPEGVDLTDIFYPGSPRPCPTDQERVACIWVTSADSETDEIMVSYWVEGFLPELEPADYHLHFYIDTLVDGDENKAGSGVPGGTWRLWDTPWPATTFGGENGRTIYSFSEFRAARARNICVLVADADHVAIPGSGNCATLFPTMYAFAENVSAEDEALDDLYDERFLSNLNEGQYAGTCALGVTAGIPDDWRWFDLTEADLAETARLVRPTAASQTEALLSDLVDAGGVIFADGPAVDGLVPNVSYSIWPGSFTINDTAEQVRTQLGQLGIDTSNGTVRSLADRDVVAIVDNNPNTVSVTYVIPDYEYAIAMTFTAPGDEGFRTLADQMAATVLGC